MLNDINGWPFSNLNHAASKGLERFAAEKEELHSVGFAPSGDWVILFGGNGVVLNKAVEDRNPARCVSFTTRGDWFCLSDNGWWTSNLDHPAAKQLAKLSREGKKLKWVAVAPVEHNFEKWAGIIRSECDGKGAGGYAFEVRHRGRIVARWADGWARAPWEKEHPSVKWTLDKPMGVASVSKAVTAVSLLKLWEETGHKVSLDEPFWLHLKRIFPAAHADVKHVTIRHSSATWRTSCRRQTAGLL
jgi:hypothetical protein